MNQRAVAASLAASPTPATINIILNGGQSQAISVADASVPLLYLLRSPQVLGLKGPKFGCGFGQCGACESYLPGFGQSARTCQATITKLFAFYAYYHIPTFVPLQVITLEGLGTVANPHPLQSAFVDQQAGQCAYCANAMIMGAYAFLHGRFVAGNKNIPTDDEVKQFLSNSTFTDPTTNPPTVSPTPYLCRCGAHLRFIRAIQAATPATLSRFVNGLI
jgi:nicotinate dehydrogenase subunit A